MSQSNRLSRFVTASLIAAGLAIGMAYVPARAQVVKSAKGDPSVSSGNFDIRAFGAKRADALQEVGARAGRQTGQDALTLVRQSSAAVAALRKIAPGVAVRISTATGGAEVVSNPRGALTEPGAGDGESIARGFLQNHAAVYGLASADVATIKFRGESVSPRSGLRMVRAEQVINGIPVFQSDSRFIIDRGGRLIRTLGAFASPSTPSSATSAPAISAAEALVAAMRSVGLTLAPSAITRTMNGTTEVLTVADPRITEAVESKLVYFPLAPGTLVLAWQQFTFTDGSGDYFTVVDASDGTLLWRKNARAFQLPTQDARFSVYLQADGITPADSPAPLSPTTATPGANQQFPEIARTIVSMFTAMDPVASPAGWLANDVTTTTGNNVDACLDRLSGGGETNVCDHGGANTLDDANGHPIGNPDSNGKNRDFLGSSQRDFNGTPPPQGGDPEDGTSANAATTPEADALRRLTITHTFYVANWYHDRLFRLGFDEAAGNFQTTNFSGMGLGGDAVRARLQTSTFIGSIVNFVVTPDGTAPVMRLPRATGPTIDRDPGLESDTVIHELTHGTSNRIIGNGTGLIWNVGRGMEEGWSEFYALSLLNNTNADDPNGRYVTNAYTGYKLSGFQDNYAYGLHRYPYTTDNTVNPLTWREVDEITQDYSGGSIPISSFGAQSNGAFDVRNIAEIWALTLWEVRARIIADPAGANGDVPTGNQTMLQLVTDAMKLTPDQPTFIEARDALIDADCATNACANERSIWEGFADRGLGYGAVAPLSHQGADGLGHISIGTSAALPRLDAATLTIDDSLGNNNGAIDFDEPVRLTVALRNPWRGAAFNVANATATLTTAVPQVAIMDGTSNYPAIAAGAEVAGDTFLIRVPQNLNCGGSVPFTLTVASPQGTATVPLSLRIGTPTGPGAPVTFTRSAVNLGIPDSSPVGVFDSLNIPDDLEIADLNLRIDSLTHTFSGDVTAMLRAPNGFGGDVIWLRGATQADGDGDNFTNTVIDDQAAADLINTTSAQAPFTGSWLPAFNSPVLGGDVDPVGFFSRLNGTSTQGTWTLQVADNFVADTGTLNGWSLIVTPVTRSCQTFVDPEPPVTTVTLAPAPTGTNGWYRTQPVSATVAAIDATTAVLETRCVLDPVAVPTTFADLPASCGFTGAGGTVVIEGIHTLYAASIDISGHAETPLAAEIRIDLTPPSLTCAAPAPSFTQDQVNASVFANAADTLSGVAAPLVSVAVDTSSPGAKTTQLSTLDLAGNLTFVTCPYTVVSPPPPVEVTIASPTADPTFTATSPFVGVSGTASANAVSVTWENDRGGSGAAAGTSAWMIPSLRLQTGANVITITATDADGNTATDTLTVNFNSLTYYLAEGSTGSFFTMDVAIANPNASPAPITITYLKDDASTIIEQRTLAATSRTTIRVNEINGLEATPLSVIVASNDMLPLAVERTMTWDASAYGGHAESAVAQPRQTWFFAEGSQGFFQTYVLVVNPNPAEADVTATFLREAGEPVVRTLNMPGLSRRVIDVATIPELADQSFGFRLEATQPIVAERSMYFGNSPPQIFAGGHASAGTPDPGTSWYFAEGATGSFFDTYILLGNPGAGEARVTLNYLLDSGITVVREKTLAPRSRLTVSVESEDAALASAAVATQVTSDVPIVAERSTYWTGPPFPWQEAHGSTGSPAPGPKWALAEGRVGGTAAYQTYILLANPSTTAAQVTISYLRVDGTVVAKNYTVEPTSRYNVPVADVVPELQDEAFGAAVTVTNGVDIFVEKAVYWNAGGVVWAGGTSVAATRLP